jgi:isoleucyl-tRNA synthetase
METFTFQYSDIFKQDDKMHLLFDVSHNSQIFNKSKSSFRFYDGPPFVTGTPHYGHLLVGITKDLVLKFKNMTGNTCLNKVGYDCHGVPIEGIVNRELNINSLKELKKIGMEQFNYHCKQKISEYERYWEPIYFRMGRWANFDNVYKTMDKNYMESVWWGFSELYKKKLIYRSYKVTAYSYQLQSPLSNFEASQNYKEIDTRSIYVKFKLINNEMINNELINNIYIVAWTTTPWTLPCNLALCVNAELDYEYIRDESNESNESNKSNDIYIIGKDKHKNCNIKNPKILKVVKGKDLVGLKYEPIYDYFKSDKFHFIVSDDYVKDSGSTGTDIVHLAPVFGEDDYRVCKSNNIITDDDIAMLEPVDENCKFTKITKYEGRLVFDVDTDIIKELKERHIHMKTQQIKHEYPFCYRTDTPLIYKICKSFYVDVQPIKNRMIELNKQTKWYPANIGSGRFHKWLEGVRDWCISRSRYFGNPIPVWVNVSDSNDIIVISSVTELERLSGVKVDDLHPEFVNKIIIEKISDEGIKTYKRVDDVFDCWFESGSMTFAQYHYPFENQNIFDEHENLCDFICEGVDQTRGWFYTLFVLSVALFDKKPATNIMVMGHILDAEKRKLSKKLQNYTDPNILLDKYGPDSVRLYLLQSPSTYAESLAFKEEDIKLINKDLFQFKNSVDFLIEHITNQKHQNVIYDEKAYLNTSNPMDMWIIQHINQTGYDITSLLNSYDVARATRKLCDMIEDITNWYLKFNRDRLKGKCGENEWIISTSVLTYVIYQYLIMMTPFTPFITQQLYDKLKQNMIITNDNKYIQECPYYFESKSDTNILDTFNLLKKVSKLVRASRMKTKTHTSTKTPIKFCEICMDSDIKLKQIESCIDLIQSELNVLDINYSKLSDNIKYKYVPNKAIIGKKYKKNANDIYKIFDKLNTNEVVPLKFMDYIIEPEEYTKEPIFGNDDIFDGDILIKIDFTYDEQIVKSSHLKRFVSDIQQTRKHMGLHPWDKISIEISSDDFNIVIDNVDYIKKRLECDVNPNSTILADRFYGDDEKKIAYSVMRL